MFTQELKQIPQELHERVQTAVTKKVDMRVKEYMKDIKEDVDKKLDAQRKDNLITIQENQHILAKA